MFDPMLGVGRTPRAIPVITSQVFNGSAGSFSSAGPVLTYSETKTWTNNNGLQQIFNIIFSLNTQTATAGAGDISGGVVIYTLDGDEIFRYSLPATCLIGSNSSVDPIIVNIPVSKYLSPGNHILEVNSSCTGIAPGGYNANYTISIQSINI